MSNLPGAWGAWGGFLPFFVAGFLVTEPWRWAGAMLGRDIDPASKVFAWVRAVSTAIVAGLVTRMLAFPAGELQAVGPGLRAIALVAGIAAYLTLGRRLGLGILAGIATLLIGQRLV